MINFAERLREAEARARSIPKVVKPIQEVEAPSVIEEPSLADALRLFNSSIMPIFEEVARLKGISIDQDPFKRGNSVFHKLTGGYILPQTNGFIRNDDLHRNAVEGALIWDISHNNKSVPDSAEFRMLKVRVDPKHIFVHNWYEPGDPQIYDEIIEVLSNNGDACSLRIDGPAFFTPSEPHYYDNFDPGPP